MRTYQLYLIVDEFASRFFGKEHKFYHLFREYDEAIGELKNILERQVRFITKPIQVLKIHHYISQNLQRNKSFFTNKGKYYIQIGKRSFAQLEIHEHCIILKASGHYEAETVFFEVLRKCETSFLAIDWERNRCAWLNPIKERKFV